MLNFFSATYLREEKRIGQVKNPSCAFPPSGGYRQTKCYVFMSAQEIWNSISEKWSPNHYKDIFKNESTQNTKMDTYFRLLGFWVREGLMNLETQLNLQHSQTFVNDKILHKPCNPNSPKHSA